MCYWQLVLNPLVSLNASHIHSVLSSQHATVSCPDKMTVLLMVIIFVIAHWIHVDVFFFFFLHLQKDPYILSLPLRFWDVVLGRYRYLDLRCPGTRLPPSTTTTPTTTIGQATVTPPIPNIIPKPEVLCSTQHMTVALPPGPVSAVVVMGRCS